MASRFPDHWRTDLFDLVIPVPLHPQRLRERGFNQALLLAEDVGRRLGIPCRKGILQKRKPTAPQVSLSGTERERGVRGAFVLGREGEVEKKGILLIDDVYTTGATVNECAKVLLQGGAKRVDVFTLTHAVLR
jgi:ComF family protein